MNWGGCRSRSPTHDWHVKKRQFSLSSLLICWPKAAHMQCNGRPTCNICTFRMSTDTTDSLSQSSRQIEKYFTGMSCVSAFITPASPPKGSQCERQTRRGARFHLNLSGGGKTLDVLTLIPLKEDTRSVEIIGKWHEQERWSVRIRAEGWMWCRKFLWCYSTVLGFISEVDELHCGGVSKHISSFFFLNMKLQYDLMLI